MRMLGPNVTAPDYVGNLNGSKYTVSSSAPTSPTPVANDIWVDTTAKLLKRYTGSIWENIGSSTPTTLFSDNFNRADSATTMGASWTTPGIWGITSSEAYCVSDSGSEQAVAEAGVTNYSIFMRAKSQPAGGANDREIGIIMRYIDINNYFHWQFWTNTATSESFIDIFKTDAGVTSRSNRVIITGPPLLFQDGVYNDYQAICNGNDLSIYVDDTLRATYTLTGGDATKFGAAGTKVGMFFAASGVPTIPARFDNFIVTDSVTHAVSYLPLSGGTVTGNVTATGAVSAGSLTVGGASGFARNIVGKPQLKDISFTATTDAAVTTTKTLDISTGNVFDLTLTGAVTITITNPAASGQECEITLYVRQGATARVITWPASIQWSAAAIPVITTINKTYIIKLHTLNGGTRWYGYQLGTNYTT